VNPVTAGPAAIVVAVLKPYTAMGRKSPPRASAKKLWRRLRACSQHLGA